MMRTPLHVVATALLASAAGPLLSGNAFAAGAWDLPFKAETLRDDERLYRHKDIHGSGGPQKYGYDLGIARHTNGAWREHRSNGGKNSDWYIYGKPVKAMEAGTVIACWRNAPENKPGSLHKEITKYPGDKSRIYGGGNGLWILQDDGSVVEYAHFIPGSVPNSLCPHNSKLLPKLIASPNVRHAWPHIRVTNGKRVRKGRVLGKAGNSGTSSNPHLHVHREKGGKHGATKTSGTPAKIKFARGLYVPRNHEKGPYQTGWKSFANKPIPSGPVLVWPARTVGKEYARHGYPANNYDAIFAHLSNSGYLPVIVDAYRVGSRNYINHVWRPAKGRRFLGYHLLTSKDYQSKFNDATRRGFHPIWVDAANVRGQARYSAVFVKGARAGLAQHGMTGPQLKAAMDLAVKQRHRAAQVSVVSISGGLRFTALFNNANIGGGWVVLPQIPESQYQAEYNAQKKAGRRPFYMHGYVHKGKRYISAVFGSRDVKSRRDRHGLSASQYQSNYNTSLNGGLLTRSVGGYDGDKSQRFVASWYR